MHSLVDLVIAAKNFSADCIPNGISDDGKMKFKEILRGEKTTIIYDFLG